MKRSPMVSFRALTIAAALDARGNKRSPIARRDLTRYYNLLGIALEGITITPDEARLLTSIDLTDTHAEPPLLWATLDNAIRARDLATLHNITDPDALVARLRALSLLETLALIDALERFRIAYAARREDAEELLRSVGLVR